MAGEVPGEGCLFCRVVAAPEKDADNLVLARRGPVIAMLNRYPYINGHMMVAPARHAGCFGDLAPEELPAFQSLLADCERALREGMRCGGMNGGWNIGRCAGAGVEGHLHLHVLPRWAGDVNFMTVTAGTRVISESLEQTRDRLLPYFRDGRE